MSRTQAIFDLCAAHLLKQGQKSLAGDYESDGCCYLSCDKDGKELMCGAAPLLDPDYLRKNYNEQVGLDDDSGTVFNVLLIDSINSHFPEAMKEEFRNLSAYELKFAKEIQTIHDSCSSGEWRLHLKELAIEYGLNRDVLGVCSP